jgi:quercetin dioxygenase-like cupin family protein
LPIRGSYREGASCSSAVGGILDAALTPEGHQMAEEFAAALPRSNLEGEDMKRINLYESSGFDEKSHKTFLVHDSPYFKIINFNFKAGQQLPVHSHDIEGQVSIAVLEGKGQFLGKDNSVLPARKGDILISDISEPHGIKAETDMRVLVTIAPPI